MPARNPSRFDREAARASGLRFHQVLDDHMEPTIRARDYVLLAPVNRWTGDGYYLILNRFGLAQSYFCDAIGPRQDPKILLRCQNKHYRDQTVTLDHFEEHVLGKVAMICNVVQPSLLPHPVEA